LRNKKTHGNKGYSFSFVYDIPIDVPEIPRHTCTARLRCHCSYAKGHKEFCTKEIIIPTCTFYSPAIVCPLMTVQRTSFRPLCIHSIQQQGMWRHNLGYTWVDIVLPDYFLPFRSLVHHSSEQKRSDILVLCRMTRKVNLYYHFVHKFPYSKYTSPFGAPLFKWRDTSNKGTQNFVPEKWTHNLCKCYLGTSLIRGKGPSFWVPFRGHLGMIDHKEHRSQWWWPSQHELPHLNQLEFNSQYRCEKFISILYTLSYCSK